MQDTGCRTCGASLSTGVRINGRAFVSFYLCIAVYNCIWFSLCSDVSSKGDVPWSRRDTSRLDEDDRRVGVRAFDSAPPPGIIHPEKRSGRSGDLTVHGVDASGDSTHATLVLPDNSAEGRPVDSENVRDFGIDVGPEAVNNIGDEAVPESMNMKEKELGSTSMVSKESATEEISAPRDPSVIGPATRSHATSNVKLRIDQDEHNQSNQFNPTYHAGKDHLRHPSYTWKPGAIDALKTSSPAFRQCRNGDWRCASRDSPRYSRIKSDDGARRLAKYFLYKLIPNDPTYHVLVKFYGIPVAPNRLARALPGSINRLWQTVIKNSFPESYARWVEQRSYVASTPGQRRGFNRSRPKDVEVVDRAAGWYLSTHRVVMLGFCFSEASHPLNPCSGHISAGMNNNLVHTLRAGLLEDEALANFRISGLGDLRRIGMVGRGNEMAAQRVIRLLLAEPSAHFQEHETLAAVLLVAPQNSGLSTEGGDLVQGAKVGSVTSGDAGFKSAEGTEEGFTGHADPLGMKSFTQQGLRERISGISSSGELVQNDRNAHIMIEMPGGVLGLDIRSMPKQIKQLLSADDGEQTSHTYVTQDDYSPQDSIVVNAASADSPLPPRKCISLDRIILQGTCRRVVAPTGVSTLLKTREFGINFTPHQRKSVEMQLPESHILVHIEILGIEGRISRRKTSKDYSLDYFTGPEFLSEYREEEPYTAAEAAVVISQRVADQSRHVWGNARVVHWELEVDNQEAEFRGTAQEEVPRGKNDYQTWKIVIAILVPSIMVGCLLVASWHCSTFGRCGKGAAEETNLTKHEEVQNRSTPVTPQEAIPLAELANRTDASSC